MELVICGDIMSRKADCPDLTLVRRFRHHLPLRNSMWRTRTSLPRNLPYCCCGWCSCYFGGDYSHDCTFLLCWLENARSRSFWLLEFSVVFLVFCLVLVDSENVATLSSISRIGNLEDWDFLLPLPFALSPLHCWTSFGSSEKGFAARRLRLKTLFNSFDSKVYLLVWREFISLEGIY